MEISEIEISPEDCENDDEDENTRRLIDINELQTESKTPFVAAVEQCPIQIANPFITPQDRWYQSYSLKSGYDRNSKDDPAPVAKVKYAVGDEISAIEAVSKPELKVLDRVSLTILPNLGFYSTAGAASLVFRRNLKIKLIQISN